MKDIILQQGRFFRLSSQSQTQFDKDSLKKILPEDVVEYVEVDGKVKVTGLISRKPRVTLGILLGRTLSLPMLNPHFLHYVFTRPYVIMVTGCLVETTESGVQIIKLYGPMSQRQWDLRICQDIYTISAETMKPQVEEKRGPSLYTTPNRVDQRGLITFNIDPPHSKDFDDAISVDVGRNKIYVHIVDIHHLLMDEPRIEMEARSLGNTLYLPEGVFNILPKSYSEHTLSLIEGEDRLVITVEMQLDDTHQIIDSKIYPAIISVKKRYNYNEVDLLLSEGVDPVMQYLDRVSNHDGWARSTLDVPHVSLDMAGCRVSSVRLDRRTPSHVIVEALMVKTNQIISERIQTSDYHKILERYHEPSLCEQGDIPPSGISDTLAFLTRLRRAKYSQTQTGHFALRLKNYTHFTSPIRRSFDVLVHKVLAGVRFQEGWLGEIIDYLNDREQLIDKICQMYQQWKLMTYLEERRCDQAEYTAEILKIPPHGIQFVVLPLLMTGFITMPDCSKFQPGDQIRVLPHSFDWKHFSVEWRIIEN